MYNIFEGKNNKISNLIKLGDYLGRSLRENVILFSIDAPIGKVSYLTENDKIISGKYLLENTISLEDIVVEDADVYTDPTKFDKTLNSKVAGFIACIYENEHKDAKSNFNEVLKLWENKVKFNRVQNKLQEKRNKFIGLNILESDEFAKLNEITPKLITFLSENKEKISKISEIKNGVIVSKLVSESFNIPKISYEFLIKEEKYSINENLINDSMYNIICKQELIKKELLENKHNFDTIWASNEKIHNLLSVIDRTDSEINNALAEAISEIPYLAIASKKQLTEVFTKTLQILDESVNISPKEIQEYSSKLFELKKPVRIHVISVLNEKYKINILNLKDPVSFRSLINTQTVIFESLAKLSPKNSVQRQVLNEMATMLKSRTGVEGIDVNNYIQYIFAKSNLAKEVNEGLSSYMDFNKIASDLGGIADILKMMSQAAGGGGAAMPGMPQPGMPNPAMPTPGMPAQPAASMAPAPKPMMPNKPMANAIPGKPNPMQMGTGNDDVEPMGGNETIGPEGEEEGMMGPDDGGVPEEPMVDMGSNQLMGLMSELETLISDLKIELGGDGSEEGPMPMGPDGDEGMEGEFDGDGEDKDISVDTGDGDDEVHIDNVDGEHNMDPDDEESNSKPVPKGKDKKESKPEPKKDKKPNFPKK